MVQWLRFIPYSWQSLLSFLMKQSYQPVCFFTHWPWKRAGLSIRAQYSSGDLIFQKDSLEHWGLVPGAVNIQTIQHHNLHITVFH